MICSDRPLLRACSGDIGTRLVRRSYCISIRFVYRFLTAGKMALKIFIAALMVNYIIGETLGSQSNRDPLPEEHMNVVRF